MISPAADEELVRAFDRFARELNENVDLARAHLDGWVRDFSLVLTANARDRFELADFGWFASCTYPDANAPGLCLVADWFAWLFLLDDHLDDGTLGRDPSRVAVLLGQMNTVLTGASTQPDAPPIVTALADLWSRTMPLSSCAWQKRFITHMAEGAAAAFWESNNRSRSAIPDEATYIAQRRHTGAIYVCLDLIEPVCGIDCPPSTYVSPVFQDALRSACDVVCWTNDIYSLAKEQSLGEYHNLVHIVGHQRSLNLEDAAKHVIERIRIEIDRFIDAQERLAAEPSSDIGSCLAGMRSWMRGNLDWSRQTKRYLPHSWPGEYVEAPVVGWVS